MTARGMVCSAVNLWKITESVHRLLELPEIEREQVLAERLEEMQRIQDKRNLDAMLRSQKAGGGADLDDSVAKSAKRGLII